MAVARPNISILGITIPTTKQEKYASSVKKREKFKVKYLSCKQEKLNKGKIAYPDDPKGPCKAAWKDWQKWRGKSGERAIKLAEQLEKKGKGDPLLLQALRAEELIDTQAQTFEVSAFEDGSTEVLTEDSGPPWLLIGAVAVGLTGLGIAIYKFRS